MTSRDLPAANIPGGGDGPRSIAAVIRPVRPVLALLLAAVLALGACTDSGELGGPAIGGTLAAKVGNTGITVGELEDEVEAWASNPEFLNAIGVAEVGSPGRRAAALVTFVLSHRIISEQARVLSEGAGILPTDADIDQIIASIDANFTLPGGGGSLFQVFGEEFRNQIGTDLAYQNNLQSLVASGATPPPVEVNGRFGVADVLEGGLVQVSPPTGSQPAPFALIQGG